MNEFEIKLDKKISIRISEDDDWIRGINIEFLSLNDVIYDPRDRWIKSKKPIGTK